MLAQEACDGKRVSVNGRVVKPSYNIKVGDIVEIGFNSGAVKFEILDIKETVRKDEEAAPVLVCTLDLCVPPYHRFRDWAMPALAKAVAQGLTKTNC